jgi:hypothetical protein
MQFSQPAWLLSTTKIVVLPDLFLRMRINIAANRVEKMPIHQKQGEYKIQRVVNH